MTTKKFNFDWRSMVLGVGLCLALVVFVASLGQGNQSQTQVTDMRNTVTLSQVLSKCELIDQRLLILEGKMNHLQESQNEALKRLRILLKEDKK